MRILGIDYGGSRTGLSLSDPVGITCSPLMTVAEKNLDRLVERIVAIVEEQGVGIIVVGLPRPLKGGVNAQTEATETFAESLRRSTDATVTMWDERFTSRLADRGRPSSSKSERDAVAACYMLQSYLDSGTRSTEDS